MQSAPAFHASEEYTMPCAEALLAGTMALMTGHVQSVNKEHRELMACKIASNLAVLAQTPLLSPGFITLLQVLSQRWKCMGYAAVLSQLPDAESRLWHSSPETVQ